MPKYIIITGVSNAGKTSTVKKLWKMLGGQPVKDTELHGTLVYKETTIGLHSCGDTPEVLRSYYGKGIPDLEKKKCDIIVSTAKSSGQTQQFFIDRSKIFDLYWVGKVRQVDEARSAEQAATHARILIDELLQKPPQK